jgi:hypothetical protein
LYDVKSSLVQVTVVPAETFRRFGTKNLLLLGDEEPDTIVTEALTETGIVSFPSKANMPLPPIDSLPLSAHGEGAKIPVPARVTRIIAKEIAITCLKQSEF